MTGPPPSSRGRTWPTPSWGGRTDFAQGTLEDKKKGTLNIANAVKFFRQTGVDALAIGCGTKHGANKGKDTVIRKEIAIATKECMMHEGIEGTLVSHGSSTVPQYIVSEINAISGDIHDVPALTENPAQLIGVFGRKGSISDGKDADLVLLDGENQVRTVFCRGRRVKG